MHDLAIVITSLNEARWLEPCLRSLHAHSGGADVQFIIVDIESTDGTAELARRECPEATVVRTHNGGFSHANNRGYLASDARYVLFLNPDTEWVEGTLADAVALMDERPEVGVAGCRQLTPSGDVYPTMRRFRTPRRAIAEDLGSEAWAPTAGQRVLDLSLYSEEHSPEWTIGSFMLTRREALLSGGCLDERYFLYAEEQDFCRRIRQAGWDIRHLPQITIVHHVGKAGLVPRLEAQRAFALLQFDARWENALSRSVMRTSFAAGYMFRLIAATVRGRWATARALAWGLGVVAGVTGSPFGASSRVGLSADAIATTQPHGSP
jgi:N-acetylglucosaminyl-diphospho-decaprenol L-rhamnosyltransferase